MSFPIRKMLGCFALVLTTLAATAQYGGDDVPAFNSAPPTRALPAILSGTQLTGMYFQRPYMVTAYQMAAKISPVLHQQPCYCRCDRAMGHNSLHSCFEGTHGAACSTCLKEVIYTYQQTKKGRTPAQIRTALEHGAWEPIDIEAAKL